MFENKNCYLDFCREKYFDCCKVAKVLEIGASSGHHSLEILKKNPEYFSVIEGDSKCAEQLRLIKHINNVTVDDVMMALKNIELFDVVICLGVLYHLHSPIHLLELIVNSCKPSIIVLDSVMAPDVLQFLHEDNNQSGANQTRPGWRSACLNLVPPFLSYLQCMDNLGYELQQVDRLQVQDYFSKQNSWMASWRSKNDNC